MIRSGHEAMLNDAQQFVAPGKVGGFSAANTSFTSNRDEDTSKQLYDHTAVWANQMFANGLSSYLTPKSDRWAYLKPQDTPSAHMKDDELLFLERLSDKIQHVFSLPASQFYPAGHETFQSIGAFGNGVVYINRDKSVITFKACPLADSFFDVNDEGDVDTMFYRKFLSPKALFQMFPDVVNNRKFDIENRAAKHELVFSVEPNDDPSARKGGKLGRERPFKITYWCPDLEAVLQKGQKAYFPFEVPRWMVMAGEVLGRGPATTCMAQIRVLNKMVKELLLSAEQSNRPPILAEENSLMLPITAGNGQVMYYEMGTNEPKPFISGSQPNLTLEMLKDYRDQITRAFFVDQIIREQKKERQSIMEVQDERGQMLQQLGPLLARMENEFLGPVIEQTIEFLQDKRDPLFEEIPESLAGRDLEIVYTSPAAHAQYASGISNIAGFMQDITPMIQQDPSLLENIDSNELFEVYARMRNIPRTVVKSKDAVAAAREERAQVEEQQQMVQAAPEMAGAMKDIASARATDPEGTGQLLNI
jgi:hypothetical protein